jgi:hypothetical protein
MKMKTTTAKTNGQTRLDNAAAIWPEQIQPSQFKKQYAHDWAPDGLAQVTPRRRHEGPPAGQGERRAVMYKGRTDQDKAPRQVRQADQVTRQAPADQVTRQAAPLLADALAVLIGRALDGFGPALAQALAAQALDRYQAAPAGFSGPVDPMGDRWPTPAEYDQVMQQPTPADQGAELADQAPEPMPGKRTRKARQADQGADQADQAQAHLPAPGVDMADYGRRKDDRPKLNEKERRQLRRQFAELDVYLNSEEMDELDESKIEWGDYSPKYIKIFMNCVRKGWSARRAHNFASKETYGKDAVIV